MTQPKNPPVRSRKEPKQTRSTELVASILQAAVQVLAQHGAHRFTTARVAERAGVSIGSIYQYFPNKAAILFRLQSDEWLQTTGLLLAMLEERDKPPLQRLRELVRAFVFSECEEAQVRIALSDAAPLYRDAPEVRQARAAVGRAFAIFMEEVLPATDAPTRALALDLTVATLSAVGKNFSETPRTTAEIDTYSAAMADMLCAYLRGIAQQSARDEKPGRLAE